MLVLMVGQPRVDGMITLIAYSTDSASSLKSCESAFYGAMRVALDVGPVRSQPAGVGTYVANLAREIAQASGLEVALMGRREDADLDASLAGLPQSMLRPGHHHPWLQLHADADARRLDADLVHYTNAAAPMFGRAPFVLTVHDLSVMRMPQTHPFARWLTVPIALAAIARAVGIIVPSRWTARELGRLGVSRDRIHVIEHALTVDPGDSASKTDVIKRLGLTDRAFVLYVGTLEPRKNLVRLIGAFEELAADDAELKLVLAGAPGWRYEPIADRIAGSTVHDRILLPGYLSRADVATLLGGCTAFCYPSLYEGYGMPVLDAMAAGAPVVTSRTTSLPQAAGGAAILVDPLSERDIAQGLRRAVAERDRLVAAGRERVASRTWADVAREHVEVYAWALSRLRG